MLRAGIRNTVHSRTRVQYSATCSAQILYNVPRLEELIEALMNRKIAVEERGSLDDFFRYFPKRDAVVFDDP